MTRGNYDRATLVESARRSIRRGSKSFAAASRLFDRETRERVWLLYAWCRACDDIADEQDHGRAMVHGPVGTRLAPEDRLATIRTLTELAMAGEETGAPAFNALGLLMREVPLTRAMVEDVLAGFALDAAQWRPRSEADMLRYCYHVAGAVGVMMASVMGVSPDDEDTLDRASDLGVAFQLGNIVRDVWEDDAHGRCYLPVEWLAEADIPPGEVTKPHYRPALVPLIARACALARQYEASARVGAARLAFRQRWAVLSAANIYGAIACEVERLGSHAWDHRVRTGRIAKLRLAAAALGEARHDPAPAPRPALSRRELAALGRAASPGKPAASG
ncbi:phytoene/squalene synthase family protein [Novosphingobium mangrovi (ex Huang et al. 2023)]|uniref:Phytoene/squalene synthase family protein n=1 Tax=Novosphingobium mangrovi (ex Huang et al. 2023) TaxID=2976432 RepID=A0ABT2I0A7_9SPHN|nr:phytoene/squalene synthase family protein [Novosphingobium mangrovi (ex Huang et al. 2023)]MCT2398052.1 phytoene/squalene synthase family protein [Novosphingobium mangrovi (ex Huang et al. 2023)]